MNWLRRLMTHFGVAKSRDDLVDRADVVLRNVDSVQITVVPKNARALAELRRLSGKPR